MSFLGKLVKGVGKVARIAAPIVGGLTLGPLGGALIGGGVNAITKGGSLADKAKAGLTGAAVGAGAGALKGGLAKVGAPAGGAGGLLGKIGSAIGKDPMKAAQIGLAGLGTLQGAQQQAKAGKINTQIQEQAMAEQAQRNALKQQLMARIGQPPPQAPNLSSLYAGSSNPFAKVA